MANFCTNCGTRLGKDDNFCSNCGTKIDNPLLKPLPDTIEKNKAKKELKRVAGGRVLYNKTFYEALMHYGLNADAGDAIRQQVEKEIESGRISSGGVEFRVNQLMCEYKVLMEKEKEEKNKKIKLIDEIFESEEIKSEIRENKANSIDVISIKDNLKDKLIEKRENMSENEIRYFIRSELKKAKREPYQPIIAKEKEMSSKKIEENETYGGYCDYSCKHYCEEFIDSGGGLDFDFTGDEIVDHYCALGHSLAYGSFCEYYEKYYFEF